MEKGIIDALARIQERLDGIEYRLDTALGSRSGHADPASDESMQRHVTAGGSELLDGKFKFVPNKEGALLGKGSFAVVYRMKNIHDGGLYAVKLLLRDKSTSPFEDLHGEIERMLKLEHSNIIRYFSAFPIPEGEFCGGIVTEICSGGSVMRDIRTLYRQHNHIEKVRKRLLQIARAVRYMHDEADPHTLHLDLKGDNVLVTSNDNVKVTDVGLSVNVAGGPGGSDPTGVASVAPEATLGAPHYRPPEARKPGYKAAKSCDMWAIGCMVTELATGKLVFKQAQDCDLTYITDNKMLVDYVIGETQKVNHFLGDAARGLLQWDPAQRWTAARLVEACEEEARAHVADPEARRRQLRHELELVEKQLEGKK